jgi:serine/threonine-protein kinase HipA
MRRCLYCYETVDDEISDFHANCSRKIYGTVNPPELPYSEDQMLQLAEKVIKSQTSVTGAQPKLSLHLDKLSKGNEPRRFTIVGLWGEYILKPPTKLYKFLPEIEDLTMHLAELSGINVVPHSLIRLSSGNLSYMTKRIDRNKETRIHMEDMCQLTERLTEHKYQGSHEQIGNAIIKYSANPGFDIINFFEQVLFSFLTGNADMHLKNFSLIDRPDMGYVLTPAYDMVASSLVVEGDEEELALTLNGKKKKLRKNDFLEAFKRFDIDSKSIDNIFIKFRNSEEKWHDFINISFLPDEMKNSFHNLINERVHRIFGNI